jgi:flavodoxin
MQTILYYFTGTGNSLAVARAIADRLPDTTLIPIPMLILKGDKVRAPENANIGIVYPLYAMGLPNIVVRFFDILDLSDAGYVFSVVTEGGTFGSPTGQIAALAKQSGRNLDAAWWIQMPDNYIPPCPHRPQNPNRKPSAKTHSEKSLSSPKQSVNGSRGTSTSPQPENCSDW